jgi:cytochrome c
MRKMTVVLILAVAANPATVVRAVAQRGTPAEAQAMLQKAVDHYKEVGRQQALADFTARKAPFADRDLYVFCIGHDRKISAHGAVAKYVGTSADGLKDADGKPLGKAILDAAAKGEGSVQYQWMNPVSHKVEPKISFVRKAGTDVCGVGAYHPE